MDTYENNIPGQEPVNPQPQEPRIPEAEPVREPVWNQQAGRAESPFADSPYVMQGQAHNPEDVRPKSPKKTGKIWRRVAAAGLAVLVVAGSCGITAASVNRRWEKEMDLMNRVFDEKLTALQEQVGGSGASVSGSPVADQKGYLTPSQVYAQNVDSVVAISNQGVTKNIYGQVSETASSGTGFILTEDGYVVSNYHVVEGATSLTVITTDRKEYPAKLVGYDAANDLSLLKIEAAGLKPVTIGSSDALVVGDQVVAIGNPLGELTSTMTVGFISAKDRTVSTDNTQINMMQTDAAINPGNSGGPLFNMKGEVVGITTAKFSGTTPSGASIEGIGFAIPIDDVTGMIGDLQTLGYVTGAYLGVMVKSMDPELTQYGLPLGSLVDSVTPGSCAEKAGIQAKDIIVNLGGYDVESNSDLTRALRKFKAGDTATVTVFRAGREVSLSITFDEKPHEETAPQPEMQPEQLPDGTMPQDGSFEDWYNWFAPFFRGEGRD